MALARHRVKNGSGRGQWLALGGIALVALVFTFAVGVLVGRQAPRRPEPAQTAEPARKSAHVPRRSGLAEPVIERPAVQEKLTFYQTLTAPLGTIPAATKPEASAKAQPPRPPAPPDRPVTPAARPIPTAPPAPTARPEQTDVVTPPPTARAPEPRTGDWAVQVGAFREREQAESVRRPLAAAGLDAYLTAVPTDDGQVRYKVRVGTFKTREDAARMAERLRQERSLSSFVTPR